MVGQGNTDPYSTAIDFNGPACSPWLTIHETTEVALVGQKDTQQLLRQAYLCPGDVACRIDDLEQVGFSCAVRTDEDVDTLRRFQLKPAESRELVEFYCGDRHASSPLRVSAWSYHFFVI